MKAILDRKTKTLYQIGENGELMGILNHIIGVKRCSPESMQSPPYCYDVLSKKRIVGWMKFDSIGEVW